MGAKNQSPDVIRLHDGRVIRLPAVMGILNVTPDSFYDGGRYLDPDRAAQHAFEMARAGAAIIDIGAESTRPGGAQEVPASDELARLLPVLQRLGGLEVPISIDTRKALVARTLLDSGATIINDVSALMADPAMAQLVAERRCAVVLMHMKGGLANHLEFASYHNVVEEVAQYLSERASFAVAAGIERSQIIVDPGIGFAKTGVHNLAILANVQRFCSMGYPVLIGASRKRFVRRIAGEGESESLFGTAAVNAIAIASGAAIVRVHDPQPAVAVSRMVQAIMAARLWASSPGEKSTDAS